MADIFQVIKYEGDNTTFIWKSPIEDFNTGTQLIVHESQEAVFFMNGQALDLFGPGRYTLETQNIPLVRKFLNKPTNDQTPYHCEVYFINKTEQLAIKWGTDSQVQYMEPNYGFPLKIGASGEMALRVEDSRKLLVKVVGTENYLTQSGLMALFRAFLMAKVKPYLAQTMQKSEFGIFEVDAHMGELSNVIHSQLIPDFADYGISLERFFVTTIVKPEGDKAYEKFREIHIRQWSDVAEAKLRQQVGIIDQQTSAQKMIIESQAMATKRATEGYTYGQERGFDVAEKVAQNEAVGGMANTGIGLGMMGGMAGGLGPVVAGITTQALNPIMNNNASADAPQTPVAGVGIVVPPVINLKDGTPAGQPQGTAPTGGTAGQPASAPDPMAEFKQKLEKLKTMKEMGMLTDEEFEAKRKELLDNL